MKKTMFGITGKVFYVVCTDYATGDFFFFEELMPDDIIGSNLELAPPLYEIIIDTEYTFKDFIACSLMESDFRLVSITEELPERFKDESWDAGIFIGNYDGGGDKKFQKKFLMK